ncbi:hypothetical protein DFH29DRAFT_880177 [Suillus ampliporus]|nr:hypothetical protein DFH29DRAFT_880177 [Suillus ampliporus]
MSILSVLLRLFRLCQVVIGGKERAFREPGLALSSQAPNQDNPISITLSVLLFVPVQTQGSNGVAPNTQSPQNSYVPWTPSSIPKPGTTSVTTPLHHVVPGQSFDITLIPIIPRQIKQYERTESQGEYAVYEVQKGPLDWSDDPAPVSGWEPLTHPEGALFFYHSNLRVFIDADIQALGTRDKIDEVVEKAYEEARNAGIALDPSVELVLNLREENSREKWGYYFADHNKHVVFWFKAHRSRYALESQYWFIWPQKGHVELYPNKCFLPKDVVVRLKEIVMHAQADNITSETCLAPFASDEVASSTDKEHEHSVWIVARFMGEFCNAKFVNFCGQPGARLDADQSLYGDFNIHSKNILLRMMNVILFGTSGITYR